MVLILSCKNDAIIEDIENSERELLEVNVFYTTESNRNLQIPDFQSQVYVYYDCNVNSLYFLSYERDLSVYGYVRFTTIQAP
jgi:hypothetical protein